MEIRTITTKEKKEFNHVVTHPLQSYEWGEFREKTGIKVIRKGFFEKGKLIKAFTLTIHKIPHTPWNIGYLPKGDLPDEDLINELKKTGKAENCIFIQLEPNIIAVHPRGAMASTSFQPVTPGVIDLLVPAAHPLFTKYTFILDLTKSEDELLKAMHPKARYNIKVAQKHGVEIVEDNSDKAFEEYWKLMQETTTRQKFYAHTKRYHKLQWEIFHEGETVLKSNGNFRKSSEADYKSAPAVRLVSESKINSSKMLNQVQHDKLTAHLLTAKYKGKTLTAWILFVFKDTLYYPYGASSSENREVMASNLIMWEAIRSGKKLGLKKFDMWGALGTEPDKNDPWYGFHNFKQKYGPEHIEFIGSFDLVINPVFYQAYKLADKLRWIYLKLKK